MVRAATTTSFAAAARKRANNRSPHDEDHNRMTAFASFIAQLQLFLNETTTVHGYTQG